MAEIVIFDWKRTLYDPDNCVLIDGTIDVLQSLGAKGLKLFLVGKDQDGSMPSETSRLEVSTYFQGIHFANESKTEDDIAHFSQSKYPTTRLVIFQNLFHLLIIYKTSCNNVHAGPLIQLCLNTSV